MREKIWVLGLKSRKTAIFGDFGQFFRNFSDFFGFLAHFGGILENFAPHARKFLTPPPLSRKGPPPLRFWPCACMSEAHICIYIREGR